MQSGARDMLVNVDSALTELNAWRADFGSTQNQLESAIKQAMLADEARDNAIAHYGPSITPYLDGQSSARVLSAITDVLESGWQDNKPKNWIRNFKIRKSLNYWKF